MFQTEVKHLMIFLKPFFFHFDHTVRVSQALNTQVEFSCLFCTGYERGNGNGLGEPSILHVSSSLGCKNSQISVIFTFKQIIGDVSFVGECASVFLLCKFGLIDDNLSVFSTLHSTT